LGLILAGGTVWADDSGTREVRPRIGLVLGGGGAKGAAHIGVLRVLEELHVPVDCVTGTSMGALVGATFASGKRPADIEKSVLAINWAKTVGTEGLRDRLPIREKLAGPIYSNSLDLGLQDGQLRAPGGLLKTQDIEDVLRNLVSDARFTRDFDDLPLPFRAIATDMLAGEMVVLDRGDLSVAMRASMAVPGAFSPVVIDERVLSDGGMMRNLPVDIARELCADVVIAVSLSSPQPKRDDLLSAVTLAGRSLDVMIDANQKAQIATLTERDVSIVVPMGDIGSASFDRVPDAIPLGREAALAMRESLLRYSVSEEQYLAWRSRVDRDSAAPVRLAEVRLKGLQRVSPDYVQVQLRNARPGAEVTTAQIVDDTSRVFALGDFERVEYRLTGPEDARVLEINAVEKSWGPDFVRFDLGLGASVDGDVLFALLGEHKRTWINRYGAEWHNTVQLGSASLIETGFYQPLDMRQRWFIEPIAGFERSLEDVFLDDDRVATYDLREGFGELHVGANLGSSTQLRAGVRMSSASADLETGLGFPELSAISDHGILVSATYDTRDVLNLPTSGMLIRASYQNSGGWSDGEQRYQRAEGLLIKAYPFRGDSLSLFAMGGGELSGDLPVYNDFTLGGIRSFPGLQRGQLRGDKYWTTGGLYLWKLADIQSLFGQAVYAGLRLQAGRMGERLDPVSEGTAYGAAVNLSARTPLGPLQFSIGGADNGNWDLQWSLGRPISEGTILDARR
jgi:NTE family protein